MVGFRGGTLAMTQPLPPTGLIKSCVVFPECAGHDDPAESPQRPLSLLLLLDPAREWQGWELTPDRLAPGWRLSAAAPDCVIFRVRLNNYEGLVTHRLLGSTSRGL